MQFISKQQIQNRGMRCGRKSQKGFTIVQPDQPPGPTTMTDPAIRGCRSTKPLLPDLRYRCGGVSLKTLNQPCPPTDLKQLYCSTAIQRGRLQGGGAQQQGEQKKALPRKRTVQGWCAKWRRMDSIRRTTWLNLDGVDGLSIRSLRDRSLQRLRRQEARLP